MDSTTAERLLDLNRDFYTRFGESFSATRQRIQPGVRRVLEGLRGRESILDLGCGNGELARELARRGHRGPYLGVDFSLPLLREADAQPEGLAARFIEADLARLPDLEEQLSTTGGWAVILAFAVLHHIPSAALRLEVLNAVRGLLGPAGRFIHSNWQFLNSDRLKKRIQPWETAGMDSNQVEAGDYVLDWRNGGQGLRYVHHFELHELETLASKSRFRISDTFHSDGEGGRLGLYQVWVPM